MPITTEIFVARAKEVHGNKYDYSYVKYEGSGAKVKIICPKKGHGLFYQTPNSHLSNHGCPTCSNNITLTTAEFIKRSREVHSKKSFDYSLSEYKNNREKIKIICTIDGHGLFEQIASAHMSGANGCPKCNKHALIGTKEFIKRSKEIHNERYDYSKVVYQNSRSRVMIVCTIHGDFTQTPQKHLLGRGCSMCAGQIVNKNGDNRRRTTEEIIKKAKEIHGDKYDYSKVNYEGANNKIKIICPKEGHGEFTKTIGNHLGRKQGCPICSIESCSIKQRSNNDKFITKAKEIHGDKYDYSKVNYENNSNYVTIICLKKGHGDFRQVPASHLRGAGCPICGGCMKLDNVEFIKRSRLVHGDIYDYSETEYKKARSEVTIICPKKGHGKFNQIAFSHMKLGSGCPKCKNKTETKLHDFLLELLPDYTIIFQKIVYTDKGTGHDSCNDFFIVELNLYIELDGDQHFIQVSNWYPPELTQAQDLTKTKLLLNEGQSLVRIYQPWVASDTNNWLEKLKENIREYENPTAVFIGPEGTYDKHKKDLHFSKLSNKFYETKMVY